MREEEDRALSIGGEKGDAALFFPLLSSPTLSATQKTTTTPLYCTPLPRLHLNHIHPTPLPHPMLTRIIRRRSSSPNIKVSTARHALFKVRSVHRVDGEAGEGAG
jgi:hypothetical protein